MVIVAQLAEHRIVVPSVAGSSPVFHPKADSFESAFFFADARPCVPTIVRPPSFSLVPVPNVIKKDLPLGGLFVVCRLFIRTNVRSRSLDGEEDLLI